MARRIKSKGARQFSIDLNKFKLKNREMATTVFRKIALDLDQSVVLDTPVDTGRARGNWFPSINTPSQENNNDKSRYSKNGASVTNRIKEKLSSLHFGQVFWLTNNVEYILELEAGKSKQSPEGMVDRNLTRIQAKFGGDIKR